MQVESSNVRCPVSFASESEACKCCFQGQEPTPKKNLNADGDMFLKAGAGSDQTLAGKAHDLRSLSAREAGCVVIIART